MNFNDAYRAGHAILVDGTILSDPTNRQGVPMYSDEVEATIRALVEFWQPIETWPSGDPNTVLLFWPYWSEEPVIGNHDGHTWWTEKWLGEDAKDPGPTHWMPLPDSPTRGTVTI